MTPARLGFVGLGQMGLPMAQRLLAWPGGLTVHDLDPVPVATLVDAGATAAADLAELATRSDLLSVMVRDDDQVRAVLSAVLPVASPGLVVAVHSTVAPTTPAELGATAAAYGVSVLDAPVSGGAVGAADGRLAVMVGGAEDDVARCREPFGLLGDLVVHAGPLGSGTAMKLARNLVHFVSFTAVTEAQRLAAAAGLDLRVLGEVVRHSDAVTGGPGAIMHRDSVDPIAPDDFWYAVMDHVRALGEKDLAAVVDLASALGVDVPLARLAGTHLGPGLGITDRGGDLP